jgi:hypothetical protein
MAFERNTSAMRTKFQFSLITYRGNAVHLSSRNVIAIHGLEVDERLPDPPNKV